MTIQKQLALFMAFMTLWMSFAPAVVAQETVRSAATASTGTAAPSSGDCDAAAEVGRRYAQGGAAASVVSVAWVCTQTDTATYAWKPESVGTGPSDPAKCTAGMLFVNTTTPTLKVCGPADTWTAVGGSSPTTITSSYLLSPNNMQPCLGCTGSAGLTIVANKLLCALFRADGNVTVTKALIPIRTADNVGTKGHGAALYSMAGALLNQGISTNQTTPVVITFPSTTLALGTSYWGCVSAESSTQDYYQFIESDLMLAPMNASGTIFVSSTGNDASGTGGSFTFPATMGALTKATVAKKTALFYFGAD